AFEEETKAVLENLEAILDGRKSNYYFEYPCHTPEEERWFILQANALHEERGGAVISHVNITDRKKGEIQLKNSEEFNRSIFENSPDCIKILELDGTLHTMNFNGLCIMEIDDFETFAGKQWSDLWEGEENKAAVKAVETARNGKTGRFSGYCKTAKGNLKYWDVTVAPVFDAEGKTRRLISTSRDITERNLAEQEREKLLQNEKDARREAEVANRLRDEFLATVSHELRAPLNAILGWGRMMQQGKLDEKSTVKAIETIVRNAESQNRLIEDLLDVSRIISGKLRLEVITVNPTNVVEAAMETVRPAAEAKNITLEISEDSELSHISGDPNRLQQVIWNLLSNAIKFTPNDGTVRVEVKRHNSYAEIMVSDSGVGIKKEFLPHVFDRFRQADASSIRKFGGLGLGLAIVRHLTEMHGGTVQVNSDGENQGSTFTVKLPLILPENEASGYESKSADNLLNEHSKISLDGLLILVVDDEEDTRQLMVQSLTYYGATVTTADSAVEGLTEFKDKNPDVLVSDIGMPEEDGYSLIRKIRLIDENIPAIALTAFARAQDRVRALASGFQTHVAKPVEPDELATVIASLTGRLKGNEAVEQETI
ncbi:MAG: hybrid sensor histidine kinase/response regulator, partial [Pyrinomonadaceae bacterium]